MLYAGIVNEIGYQLGMVSNGDPASILPDKPSYHYVNKGHQGNHCHSGLAVFPSYENVSGVNYLSTRRQKTIDKKTGGVARPPAGAKGAAVATLVLDVAIIAYDIALPIAVNRENNKIKEHYTILVDNAIRDVNTAMRYGLISDELTYKEICQLVSVLLYGGDADVSDKVYEIGCDVYEHVSEFKKR